VELDYHPRWRLDIQLYDGNRIEYPLPEDFTWEDARNTRAALRARFVGRIQRCSILSQRAQRPRNWP
jgi:hypothetical protein